jgi:holliday junction resolvase Hjr
MSNKSRGTNAERDLIHKFWAAGWAAIRVAGSGSSQFPSPDLLAGNNLRKLAIEAKLTTDTSKYFPEKEIDELSYFSKKFGAEPWLALKFFREDWRFLTLEDAEKTGKNYCVTLEVAKRRELLFEELIEQEK